MLGGDLAVDLHGGDHVAPTYGRVSSCYGARWGVTHYGVDIAASIGTPIYAVTSGTVVTSGYSGAYGNLVTFVGNVNGSSVEVRNAHMSSIAVGAGQTVSAGQVISYVGDTGNA